MSFPVIGHHRAAEAWSPATFDTQVQPRKSNIGSTDVDSIGIVFEGVIEWDIPEAGIVLVELFGGAANGLKALLQSHIKVARYIYVDADEEARAVAKHHIDWFITQYPTLGFSCGGFSSLGSGLGFKHPQTGLFINMMELLHDIRSREATP
eukprot:SM000034S12745  [mRNA]  locus=s34:562723:563284:+ [translate_table: standard]